MAGTNIYNKDQQQIYPVTTADAVVSNASGKESNVEQDLLALYSRISALSGDSEAVSNIIITVTYCKANTKDEAEVKQLTSWSSTFSLPDSEYPYVWKKTLYSYKGDAAQSKIIYEIVATDTAEQIQNIYIAKSTSNAPIITYPVLTDGYGEPILDANGNKQDDLTAFDNKLPEGWSETPASISPATPYAFMATRKRVEGLWKRYSEPAQYGRWAFDSKLEVRYAVGDSVTVDSTNDDPGDSWVADPPSEFTGKLWMITATSVNGVLNEDDDNIKWHGPTLMAIIKSDDGV